MKMMCVPGLVLCLWLSFHTLSMLPWLEWMVVGIRLIASAHHGRRKVVSTMPITPDGLMDFG